jgi:uncharacterized membrane protein
MREWLVQVTEIAVIVIDWMALLIIIAGTVEAFIGCLRGVVGRLDNQQRREVWLRFARWLVAALTFQLAADIIETSIRSDWQAIGQIGAIAVIRTFLNYFLERDLGDLREQQRVAQERNVTGSGRGF